VGKRQESAKPASAALRPALFGVPPELQGAFIGRQIASVEPLWSDRFSPNMAIFPKSNRIIINEQGVFIPQSVLGHNVDIRVEEERVLSGRIRVVISAYPRNKPSRPPRRVDPIDCSRELRWLKEHRQEYMGQWVALDGDRLVAHGTNGREVYEEARQSGVEVPALVKIDPSDELPFGGW
jgi:hypothetical protein